MHGSRVGLFVGVGLQLHNTTQGRFPPISTAYESSNQNSLQFEPSRSRVATYIDLWIMEGSNVQGGDRQQVATPTEHESLAPAHDQD